jgi:hypothetical protein
MHSLRAVSVGSLMLISSFILISSSQASSIKHQASSCSSIDRAPGWDARENAKTGTEGWDVPTSAKHSGSVSGWFDKVSLSCGNTVGLHLSGNGRDVTVKIYRMGYYNGALARLLSTQIIRKVAKRSPAITTSAPAKTVYTDWPVSKMFTIGADFPTGIYMARFDDGSKVGFAPLIVKDDLATAPLLLVASTMTWQAYNTWGGYSLYHGPDTKIYDPGRIVSFDRPYDREGKSNYTVNEAGLIQAAESAGLDVSYSTDNDLDAGKTLPASTKTIIFGGHSEYWSTNMQNAVFAARDLGVNILFFGGNQAYWRARIENGGRNLAVWKSDPLDPYKTNPKLITNKWGAAPNPLNQSLLLGALSAGDGVVADYRVRDGSAWPFAGTNLATGNSIVGVVGNEVDTTDRGATPGVQTFLTSKVTLKNIIYNVNLTYYNTNSHAGVIDVSTNGWICSITKTCPWTKTIPATSKTVTRITQNILLASSKGPLGDKYPAKIDIFSRTEVVEICDLNCPDTSP